MGDALVERRKKTRACSSFRINPYEARLAVAAEARFKGGADAGRGRRAEEGVDVRVRRVLDTPIPYPAPSRVLSNTVTTWRLVSPARATVGLSNLQ